MCYHFWEITFKAGHYVKVKPMPDVFTKENRSEVMSRIRGKGNKRTEGVLVKLFREDHTSPCDLNFIRVACRTLSISFSTEPARVRFLVL